MGLTIYTGRIDLTEPDGVKSDYERFMLTANPDGSRTLRTVTRSPKGDLLRDVNQMHYERMRDSEIASRIARELDSMAGVSGSSGPRRSPSRPRAVRSAAVSGR